MQKLSTLFLSIFGIFGSVTISARRAQQSSPFPIDPNNSTPNPDNTNEIDESTMDTLPDAEQLLALQEKDLTCSGNPPLDTADCRSIARDAYEHLPLHFSRQPHTD